MFVTKRSGEIQELNISKVKEVVKWATEGLDVNPLELESNLTTIFRDRIPTAEINENMIFSALRLASFDTPDWLKVAGRLKYRDIRDRVEKARYYRQGEFLTHVYYHISEGTYDGIISTLYTDDEIEGIGEFLVNDRDLLYDYTGINQLEQRYLLPTELPQEAFLVIAMFICQGYGGSDRLTKVREVYDLLSLKQISLATPILANLRKPDANLASCFILSVNDDLDSIFTGVHDTARISKNGGGVGLNVSHIRARGSEIKGNKNASNGVVPLIKIFNDTGVAIDQGGKRSGAITVSLDVWHLDITEFLEMQTEKGDVRLKAFDVFPQIVIPDLFMEKVKEDEPWLLFDPHEVKQKFGYDFPKLWGKEFDKAYRVVSDNSEETLTNYKWVRAKELFKDIIKSQIETGLPYLFFKDTANRFNPNKGSGYIPSANLCVAPETKILTDHGYVCIGDFEWYPLTVWNGEEYSEVIVRKTGVDKELIKVSLSSETGVSEIECTPDHTFYLYDRFDEDGLKTPARYLNLGYKLIPTTLPNGDVINWEVVKLEKTGRISDTFCVTEPKRHKVVFNGVLTGQCVESFSNVTPDLETHVCNLVSVNLAELADYQSEHVMKWAVEILDNCIDLTTPPTEYAKTHNNLYRTIGVGYMGLADWLAIRGLNYVTGKREIFNLFDRLAYYGVKRSHELAITRGAYPKFGDSEWAKGVILGRSSKWFMENSDQGYKWLELAELIKDKGIRNGQIFAIAPNTSSSLIQGCTASILPPYKLFFVDFNSKGSNPVSVPYLKHKRWYYTENKNTNQQELVETIGKCIAPFIDSGISMELVFDGENPQVNSKFIAETIFKAWESGNKTVYYVRLTEEEANSECLSCAN